MWDFLVCYLVEGLLIDCCTRGPVYLCLVWKWSILLLLVVSASEISYPVCFAYHSMPPRAFFVLSHLELGPLRHMQVQRRLISFCASFS